MKKGLEIGTGDKPQQIEGYNILHTDKFPQQPEIIQLDADKTFPYPNNNFDLVIAFGILEHVTDFYFTINEIHRILKPNGILKCDLPHFTSTQYYWEGDHKRHGHSRIFHSYTEPKGDKGMQQQSQNRKFKQTKFDYCIQYGKITKPIINLIGFQKWEKNYTKIIPLQVDFLFIELKKIEETK